MVAGKENPIQFTIGAMEYSYYESEPESGERLSWVEAQRFCQHQAPGSAEANLAVFDSREHMRLVIGELNAADRSSRPWVAYRIDNSFQRLVMAIDNTPSANKTFLPALASPTLPFQQPGTCGVLNMEPGDDGLFSAMGVVQSNCFIRGPWLCQRRYEPCLGNTILNRLTHRCRLNTNTYHTCLGTNLFLSGACPSDHVCVDCGKFVRASNNSFSSAASVCHMPDLSPKCV